LTVLLWILGVLAAFLLLVCLTRVGAQIVLKDGSATVDVRVSVFRIRVYPEKESAGTEKKEKKQQGKGKDSKKAFPKPSLEDIKDAAKTLWPPLKKAVGRVRRGIRISPMDISLTLGGLDDPAKTSELYGYLHSGMWSVMPVLEEGLDIPDPHLHIGIDFNTEKTVVEGELGVTARIGTLLAAGLCVGIPALRWFLKYRKKMKKQTPATQTAA
jgi:hypothetical protein